MTKSKTVSQTLPEGVVQMTRENMFDTSLVKWSGEMPVPSVNDTIQAPPYGAGVVLGYRVTRYGWLELLIHLGNGQDVFVFGRDVISTPKGVL